jgi:hypothetical protein
MYIYIYIYIHIYIYIYIYITKTINNNGVPFIVGPGVCLQSWDGPMNAVRRRVSELVAQPLPTEMLIFAYNSQCVSLLLYIGQLLAPPAGMPQLEMVAFNRILKMPGSFCSIGVATGVAAVGARPGRSCTLSCLASLLRVAVGGKVLFQEWCDTLKRHYQDLVSPLAWVKNAYCGAHWASPGCAASLETSIAGSSALGLAPAWQAMIESAAALARRCLAANMELPRKELYALILKVRFAHSVMD